MILAPVAATSGTPTAATITVAQTLALLDGQFSELAIGAAEGQYAFWLGSGISRDAVEDLKEVVKKVLRYLREHADFAAADCPFAEALGKALALAQLSEIERAHFDPKAKFEDWDDAMVKTLQDRLTGKYSRLLDIRVKGKDPDFLLWEVVNVPAVYANPALTPSCEHLCIGILGIEGVVSEAPTANWDGLIEKGVDELAGPGTPILRVCVIADDFVQPLRRMRLLKFHGCAVRARDNPGAYRQMLVGRQGDIEDWANAEAFTVMRQQMVSLATVRHTLMIGLSAQDTNIRDVFRDGKAAMAWLWPSHPPAYVFAEDVVGDDQRIILGSVYRDAYDADGDRTVYVRALVAETARALRILRGTSGGPGAYEALSTHIVSQIPADPNNGTSGLPELATALGLLGLGEARADWTVGRADPSTPANGSLTVTPAGGTAQRVFFVANQEADLALHMSGAVGDNDPDAVIIFSTSPGRRARRSPRRSWRTADAATRRVGIRTLLGEALDVAELSRRFREEAVL